MSQQINLFNPAFESRRRLLTPVTMAGALGGVALVMLVLGVLARARVAGMEKDAASGAQRLEQVQARLTQASSAFGPRTATAALGERLAAAEVRLEALQKAEQIVGQGSLGNTQGYAEYFRALARQSGQGLWLTGVGIGGAGLDLAVRGRALDAALVPGFIARLGGESVMRGKTIGSLVIGEGARPQNAEATPAAEQEAGAPPYVEFQFQSAPATASVAGAALPLAAATTSAAATASVLSRVKEVRQ